MRKKIILLLGFLLAITLRSWALVPSPQMRCVSVLPGGDVTLSWTPTTDPGGQFNAYMVYTSGALGGPYTLLDSIFVIGQSTYTHVGANANTASVYYYIRTRCNCGTLQLAPALDTVHSMLLNVTNPGNGTAVLSWNSIASPPIASSTGIYNVYEEYPAGTWRQIGSTTHSPYIDTILECNAAINFRIEIADGTGCVSVSSVNGGVFRNMIAPAIPVVDTLSIDDNNHAMLSWNVSPSADVAAYIVYRFTGGIWVAIDTIHGINNTSYTYTASTAGAGVEQYRLNAYDTCGNICPLGPVAKTIHLSATNNICDHSAILSWTTYGSRLGTGIAGYNVYESTVSPTGPYSYIGSTGAGVMTFTQTGLPPNQLYYFKVIAFDSSGVKTVSSNRYTFYSAAPIPPNFSYLRKASVTAPDKITITCHIDVAASTLNYKLLRSTDDVTYTQIATLPRSTSTPIMYTDTHVHTDDFSYYYKIINVDSCGFDGMVTNVGRTMLLKVMGNSDNHTNDLVWNDYESWLGTVMSYNIYRGIDGVIDPAPIANVPFSNAGTNYYTDYISAILNGQGVFNYYIEAVEGMGNPYGFSDNSYSNTANAYQDPQVFIPNAFKPSGVNSVFIPVTTYVGITEYSLDIFNRWGLKVFSTTNQDEGWDGTRGSEKCELGVYVYLLRFRTSKGDYMEMKGTVTLLR